MAWRQPRGKETHSVSLQVWLPLDGNLNNQGIASCSATAGWGVSVSNNGRKGQHCYYLNSDNINLGIAPFKTATSAWTMALWIKVGAFKSGYDGLFCASKGTGWGDCIGFVQNGGTNVALDLASAGHPNITTLTAGVWTHLCATYDNRAVKVYVNGALKYTTTTGSDINFANMTRADLNSWYGSYKGQHYENDVRFYDTALTEEEVILVMNGDLYCHYPLNGQPQSTQTTEFDISGNHNDAIASTNLGTFIKNSDPDPIRYPSYYFFNNRYIRKTDLTYNGNQYSISCWINTSAIPTNFEMIYSWNNNATTGQENAKCRLYLGQTTTTLTCQFEKQSQVVSTNNLNINTWYHITITYNSTTCKMYINGEVNNSSNGSSQINNASILTIGGGHTATNQAYPCTHVNISDFRFYTKCLTADEVSQLYNMGI